MLRTTKFKANFSNNYQITRNFAHNRRNKLSSHFVPSTKDKATSTNLSSHNLLLRSGTIRQSGSGIYSLLPLGLRIVEKIECIIDEEMQSIGSQKLSLPILLSPEDWKKTGRWDGATGEFFRVKDRKDFDLLLAPTHEEEITRLVSTELRSRKQLPIRLYQIGRKYRDELRPRAGLLRGREFIMKDLYSFDDTTEDAFNTYSDVTEAYKKIFERLGVPFVIAEADSGNIGGSKSHEYHLISTVGEDTLLTCSGCGYTANEELAIGIVPKENSLSSITEKKEISMAIMEKLNIKKNDFDSAFISFRNTGVAEKNIQGYAAVLIPSGRTFNILKVQTQLNEYFKKTHQLEKLGSLEIKSLSEEIIGKVSPDNLHVFLDDSIILSPSSALSGLTVHKPDHFRLAKEGDHCTSCSGLLSSVRAIECGHTFYLGTKYSSVFNCGYEINGVTKYAEMGCYGIGITRLLAAIAESRQDEKGIAWPKNLAPYRVCIIPTSDNNEEFAKISEGIYDTLNTVFKGNVILDDRRLGFGAKMKDAELVGYPYTLVVSKRSLTSEKTIELHERVQGKESKKVELSLDKIEELLAKL